MNKKNSKLGVFDYVFLLSILIIGLVTCIAYGGYLDYNAERTILFANIKEYCLRIFPDANLIQSMTEQGIIEISKNVDRDHGVALYYVLFLVFQLFSLPSSLYYMFWKVNTFLLFYAGIYALYRLVSDMFQNRYIAILTSLLFWFTPRIFAESHYNNKDIVLLSMMLCIFYYGYRLMLNTSIRNLIVFACVGAFATNIKIIGAWTFGLIGIYIVIYNICMKQFNTKLFFKMLSCIVIYVCVFMLITPAAWDNIIDFFGYLIGFAVNYSRWNDYVLFNGNLIHHTYTGMPKKYLIFMVLFTVPVVILMLILVGGIVLLYNTIKHHSSDMWMKEGYAFMVLLAGGIPFAYAVVNATPLYNGWRHFYFTYASMIILVAYACYFFYQRMQSNTAKRCFQGIAMGYLLFLAGGIMINYPQEHSYYNILAGKNLEDQYELDYWGLSAKQALGLIHDEQGEEATTVAVFNLPSFWGVELNYNVQTDKVKNEIQLITELEKWQTADYVIVNTTYANMYNKEQYSLVATTHELLGEICSYGNTICEVYKKK